jgi:spore maturation protein CgeB
VKHLSILYLGLASGTTLHRLRAMERLGHKVVLIDPRSLLPSNRNLSSWIHHTGALFLDGFISRKMLASLPPTSFDLVWIEGGELTGPALIEEFQRRYGCVINYNHDDPYGKRDGCKWRLYLKSVPHYSLITVVRDENVEEAYAAGAKDVFRLDRSADEVAHAPRPLSEEDRLKWSSEVLFVGTWMPERGPFMARLVELGVPLALHGHAWHKAKEWPVLKPFWRSPGLYNDENYAKAIQCARVTLGLLSKGNRDAVTTRSFEVPYLGGVLCAERTDEHQRLYTENVEAVFWSTPEECAAKCRQLLQNETWRAAIAKQGRIRCIANGTTHQQILTKTLNRALALRDGNMARLEVAS